MDLSGAIGRRLNGKSKHAHKDATDHKKNTMAKKASHPFPGLQVGVDKKSPTHAKGLGKQVTSKKGTKYYPHGKGEDNQARDNALAALYNRKKG